MPEAPERAGEGKAEAAAEVFRSRKLNECFARVLERFGLSSSEFYGEVVVRIKGGSATAVDVKRTIIN
jgi:hypothetical protein